MRWLRPLGREPSRTRTLVLAVGAPTLATALALAAGSDRQVIATSAYLPWLADDKAAEATFLSAVDDQDVLREAAKRADEAMQLNPLSIDPVTAAIAKKNACERICCAYSPSTIGLASRKMISRTETLKIVSHLRARHKKEVISSASALLVVISSSAF